MATTTAKFPQSAVTAAESPWLDNDWVSPTNIYADDTNYASVTDNTYDPPDQTYVLKAYNFDFSAIPDGATILGVTCVVSAWTAAAKVQSLDLCQLLDTAGAKVGTNMAATPIQVGVVEGGALDPIGAADNLWGNALTPAWVKNSNFGVALGFVSGTANSDIFVDYVTLEIEYSSEDYSGSASISGGGSTTGSVQKGGGGTAAASAAGMLAALGMVAMLGIGAITGGGSQSAEVKKGAIVSGAISGGGSLTATGLKSEGESHYGTASISGGGSLVGTGLKKANGVAALSGNGTLTSSGKKGGRSPCSISATGQLVATGQKRAIVEASVSGSGSLVGTGERTGAGTAVISGGGSITATGLGAEDFEGVATISGGGSLVSTGKKAGYGTAQWSGGGSLDITADKATSGSGSISGGGLVTASGHEGGADEYFGDANISGRGGLVASGLSQVTLVVIRSINSNIVLDACCFPSCITRVLTCSSFLIRE